MPAYLGALGALGRVHPGTDLTGHDSSRPGQWNVSPGGQAGGRLSSHRDLRRWRFAIPITHGETVLAYRRANAGAFGVPCLWIPADAAGGNLLTPEQSDGFRGYGTLMWSNGILDRSPVPMPDGGIVGGTILRSSSSLGRVLLDGRGEWAKVPVIPGRPFHFSALLNATGAAVRVFFRDLAGGSLSGGGARSFTGTNGVFDRTTYSATAPAGAAYAICQVDGDGRIADPVASITTAPPMRSLDGRGVAGVHVARVGARPITIVEHAGPNAGVRSAYDVEIDEVVM